MRFSALFTVLAGLCSISNALTDVYPASRTPSLKERAPVHPRDFSIGKRDAEVGYGEVGEDENQIAAIGVNGCIGTFIWAGDLVFGAHTICGSETDDMENLKGEVEDLGKENDVTSVTICYPEDVTAGLQELKDGLAWTGVTIEVTTYPYDVDVDNVEFTLTAKVASPGEVEVASRTT